MNKIIAIILTLTLTFSNAIAQRNPNTNANKINKNQIGDTIPKDQKLRNSERINYQNKGQAGAYLNYGTRSLSLPENEGIGFGFKLGKNLFSKNLLISLFTGLGFDYLYFGGKSTNQNNNVKIAVNSNAYGWYPYLDLELGSNWPITLFGTAYWGGRFFFTRQNINYTDANNQPKTDSKNLDGDVTQIYGIGGGLKLRLIEGIKLELRYQQNHGNEIKIVDPNTIQFDSFGNLKTYQNKRTDTDLEMLFIGLIVCF